jgi:UDPglucose 6-dehydrogenase
VVAYDPEARASSLTMVDDPVAAARDADVLLVATEWPEFLTVDMAQVARAMKGHRVVDARNMLDPAAVRAVGLDYWGLGRPGA